MPIDSPTLLTSGTGTAASSFALASVSPRANRRQLLAVLNRPASGAPATPTVAGCNLTWNSLGSQTYTSFAGATCRLTLFESTGAAPTTDAPVIDFGDSAQTSCGWSLVEYDGADTSVAGLGTPGTGSGSSSPATVSLAAMAAGSITYSAVAAGTNLAPTITPEGGHTALHSVSPSVRDTLATQSYAGLDTSPSATFGTVSGWAMISIEIRVAAAETTYCAADRGTAALLNALSGGDRGLYSLAAFTAYSGADRGSATLLAAWEGSERGLAPLIFQAWAAAGRGAYSVFNQSWLAADRGVGRLANAIPVYAAWVAPGSTPDTTADPDAEGDALPLVVPLTANAANHIVVAKRNQWGLACLIAQEMIVTLDAGGEFVLPLPTAPEFTAEAAASLKIRVRASYHWGGDDALGSDADTWLVYTRVGSDPTPGVDTPGVATMDKSTYEAVLDYTTAAFSAGQVVHVLVTVRRSADSVASTPGTAAEVTISADASGNAAVNPRSLLGDELADD